MYHALLRLQVDCLAMLTMARDVQDRAQLGYIASRQRLCIRTFTVLSLIFSIILRLPPKQSLSLSNYIVINTCFTMGVRPRMPKRSLDARQSLPTPADVSMYRRGTGVSAEPSLEALSYAASTRR